jgi:hypothetical protein
MSMNALNPPMIATVRMVFAPTPSEATLALVPNIGKEMALPAHLETIVLMVTLLTEFVVPKPLVLLSTLVLIVPVKVVTLEPELPVLISMNVPLRRMTVTLTQHVPTPLEATHALVTATLPETEKIVHQTTIVLLSIQLMDLVLNTPFVLLSTRESAATVIPDFLETARPVLTSMNA